MIPGETSVVVVGAGVIGASVAYHLTQLGVSDVLLLEKESAGGAGSTGLNAGGVRAQFSTEVNIRLSLASLGMFERMERDLGLPIEFQQSGYLFLMPDEDMAELFADRAVLQRSLGVEVDLLENADIQSRWPYLRTDDLAGGVFGARDGYLDPIGVWRNFLEAARTGGAQVVTDTEFLGVTQEDGRVTGVETTGGTIVCEKVVDAAGPWGGLVAERAGVQVPAEPVRRQLYVTDGGEDVPHGIPLTVDMGTGLYVRPESPGLLLGLADTDETPGFKEGLNEDFFQEVVLEAALERIPSMENAAVPHMWPGYYSVTPDHHGVIGEAPELRGFILCLGFSGHGMMQSPASGRAAAEIVVHGESNTLDVAALSPSRFATGGLLDEQAVI